MLVYGYFFFLLPFSVIRGILFKGETHFDYIQMFRFFFFKNVIHATGRLCRHRNQAHKHLVYKWLRHFFRANCKIYSGVTKPCKKSHIYNFQGGFLSVDYEKEFRKSPYQLEVICPSFLHEREEVDRDVEFEVSHFL